MRSWGITEGAENICRLNMGFSLTNSKFHFGETMMVSLRGL